MANPSPAFVKDGSIVWSDTNLRYGVVYGYRIRALSARGGTSAWSDEVRVSPLVSLAVPRGVVAKGGDGFNQIAWEAVTTRIDGSRYDGFVGYNVYRGVDKGRYEDAPLNKEPLTTNSYKDTAVANEKTYYYMVRAVDRATVPWKESPDSEESSATPRDLTPPARPTGLTVVPGLGRTFLLWNENKERDLAGYYVYRSTKSGGEYMLLTDKPLVRTTFSDETVKSGTTYYYAVSAIDKAGNESDLSDEKQAAVEKLR
jgi:fibronectin type 3 domain-containing protein